MLYEDIFQDRLSNPIKCHTKNSQPLNLDSNLEPPLGHTIAQVVSYSPPTLDAKFTHRAAFVVFLADKVALEWIFLQVLQFSH